MAKLRWGIKTSPQHTTYDAMLEVWQEADRTPAFEHAWLFDHFTPIQGEPGRPLLRGLDAAGGPGRPDVAPAPRSDGRRQHLPPPRGPRPHGGHRRRHLQRPPRLRRRRRLERVRAPEHGHPALRRPASASGASARPARSRNGSGPSTLTDFDGRYYQLKEARCEPKPVQKPYPPVRHRRQRRAAHPARRGAVRRHLELRAAPTWRPSGTRCASCTSTAPPSAAIPRRSSCRCRRGSTTTTSPATVATLQPLVDAGATHLVLMLTYPYPDGIVARLADEVVARFD